MRETQSDWGRMLAHEEERWRDSRDSLPTRPMRNKMGIEEWEAKPPCRYRRFSSSRRGAGRGLSRPHSQPPNKVQRLPSLLFLFMLIYSFSHLAHSVRTFPLAKFAAFPDSAACQRRQRGQICHRALSERCSIDPSSSTHLGHPTWQYAGSEKPR